MVNREITGAIRGPWSAQDIETWVRLWEKLVIRTAFAAPAYTENAEEAEKCRPMEVLKRKDRGRERKLSLYSKNRAMKKVSLYDKELGHDERRTCSERV